MPGRGACGNHPLGPSVDPATGSMMEQAMQVPNNSVVLVADGRKSLFFRNEGDALDPPAD